MLHHALRAVLVLLAPALLLATPGLDADAKLDLKEWRLVQNAADTIFEKPGETEAKTEALAKLIEDGEKRAWRLLADLLVKESRHWISTRKDVAEKEILIDEIQAKPMRKRTPDEQTQITKWKEELKVLDEAARAEHAVFTAFTEAIASGPEVLRKNLYSRAKGSTEWSVRAAAASVAGAHVGEKISFEYLNRALQTESDARVRLAGLDALGTATQGSAGGGADAVDVKAAVEGLVIGRLADPDWGVQLLAVEVVLERKLAAAIPHLITALGYASPRVVAAIGKTLRDFTGENFDPYADVWAQWWEEHKEQFESNERVRTGKNKRRPADAHIYGLPVKSDRILFIIDTSSSMKLPTKNVNPAEKWKDRGPVSGDDGPPPPPPPEEILSGPKIEVAKHELKKALMKLTPTCKFNIIAFSTAVTPWRKGMQKADAKTKKEALQWVRALQPRGITYIDGALRLGFKMAGIASFDRAYPHVNIDTMILIADGAPTDDNVAEVNLMDPEIILGHVREWNRHKRIVVNCVGVDLVEGIEFMRKLAAQNGGWYIDR